MDTDASIADAQVREQDNSGALRLAGYCWYEPRPVQAYWFGLCEAVSWGFGGPALVMFIANRVAGVVLATFVVISGLTCRLMARDFRFLYREISFDTEGAIHVTVSDENPPKVVPRFARREHHSTIVSIEALPHPAYRSTETNFGVKFFYRSGRSDVVTMNLYNADEARIVAMQLTLALEEIRSAGTLRAAQSSPAASVALVKKRAQRVVN